MNYLVRNRANGLKFVIQVNDLMAFELFMRANGFVKHMGEYIGANYIITRTND